MINVAQILKQTQQEEYILVVSREKLFLNQMIENFVPVDNFTLYQDIICEHQEFLPRSAMEIDPSYKQIIPYVVFCYEKKFFLMQRKSTASEQRLKDKYLLGIGGHLRKDDMHHDTLAGWAEREIHEEILYDGRYIMKPLGIINHEHDLVGKVHIGFVFLMQADSLLISVKSELKQGTLLSLEDIKPLYEKLEPWSQMIFDYLLTISA